MAKKEINVCGSGCCNPCWGLIIVIVGILYLLLDYGLITWFRLSWWTSAFILLGIYMVCCRK